MNDKLQEWFWLAHDGLRFAWHWLSDRLLAAGYWVGDRAVAAWDRVRDWGSSLAVWAELWSTSRNWRHLILGMPFALVGLLVLLLTAWAATKRPRNLVVAYQLEAQLALARKDYASARTCLERLLLLGDSPQDLHLALVLTAEELGQSDYAQALWDRLTPVERLGLAPAYLTQARRLLAEDELAIPHAETAERLLLRVVAAVQAAASPAVAQRNLELDARTLLGELCLRAGRIAEAEDHFTRAVALEASAERTGGRLVPNRSANRAVQALFELGRLHAEAGRYSQAEHYLLLAVQHLASDAPAWLEAHALLGRLYVRSGRHLEGRPYLLKAAQAPRRPHPALVEVHTLLGLTEEAIGNQERAEEHYRLALAPDLPLAPVTQEALTLLGQILVRSGRLRPAESELRRAVTLGQPGQPLTVLAQMLLGKVCLATGHTAEAEKLLLSVTRAGGVHADVITEARLALGQLYVTTDRAWEAEPYLQAVVQERPEAGLALARLLAERGQRTEALRHTRAAEEVFRRRSERNPLEPAARIQWAEALAFRGEHAQAVKLLEARLQAGPVVAALSLGAGVAGAARYLLHEAVWAGQLAELRAGLVRVYRSWLETLERTAGDNGPVPLALLERLLLLEPHDADVLSRLVSLARLQGPAAARLRHDGQTALQAHTSPVLARLLLGWDALVQGQSNAGRRLLDEAVQQGPAAAAILNNLAGMISQREAAVAPHALVAIEAVLARFPQEARFRATRGQILARLGRWQEARRELEAALPGMPDPRTTHQILAEVCKQLGDLTAAAEHTRQAGAWDAPTDPP